MTEVGTQVAERGDPVVVEPVRPVDPPREPSEREQRGLPGALVVAGVLAGMAARIVVLAGPLGRPDADELIAGLMAREVSSGFPTFFWGQEYGGTAELVPVALAMRFLGDSVLAMRVPTIALSAVNALLVWRLATRVLPSWRAQLAGLVAWVWPALGVWFGVREMLFYVPTVTLGLLMVLFAYRSQEHEAQGVLTAAVDIGVVGCCFGVAWWVSPNIAYFVPPTAVVLAFGLRRSRRRRVLGLGALLAVPAAALGALPWLVANRDSGFASLEASTDFPVTGTYPERFLNFFTEHLPGALGFRGILVHEWWLPPASQVLWAVLLGAILAVAVLGVRRGHWDAVGFLVAPFIFAAVPFVLDDPNLRYVFFVLPFVDVLVARLAVRPVLAPLALALAVTLTTVGLIRLYSVSELDGRTYRVGNVGDLDAVGEVLDARGIDAVYGEYWIAYRLLFETDGEVAATPSWGLERVPEAAAAVRADEAPAWVVTRDSIQQFILFDSLDRLGVGYDAIPAGDFAVVVTDRPVAPEELPEGARVQTVGGMPRRSGG